MQTSLMANTSAMKKNFKRHELKYKKYKPYKNNRIIYGNMPHALFIYYET